MSSSHNFPFNLFTGMTQISYFSYERGHAIDHKQWLPLPPPKTTTTTTLSLQSVPAPLVADIWNKLQELSSLENCAPIALHNNCQLKRVAWGCKDLIKTLKNYTPITQFVQISTVSIQTFDETAFSMDCPVLIANRHSGWFNLNKTIHHCSILV